MHVSKKLCTNFDDPSFLRNTPSTRPIFCEPLNGKLLEFPVTLTKLQKISTFQLKTMQKLNFQLFSLFRRFQANQARLNK